MITITMARSLRSAGLSWHPVSGDAFRIDRPDLDGDVFHVSDMTIEPHEFDTGTILGFNGTTEWALDSLAVEDALWLPREDQLRLLLGDAFQGLRRHPPTGYQVDLELRGSAAFTAPSAADAYGLALLHVLRLEPASVRERGVRERDVRERDG